MSRSLVQSPSKRFIARERQHRAGLRIVIVRREQQAVDAVLDLVKYSIGGAD